MAGATYPDDGDLTLELDGVKISGWQKIRVTRGVERCPSDFDIALTEKFPSQAQQVVITPGQVCRVKIGGDLVLTGYVDRYAPSISADQHSIRIMGRSACEDIVDCSAVWRGSAINGSTVRSIAEKLCQSYGVTVTALAGDGPIVPQLLINLGETPFQIIERITRYGSMLAYDDPTGNLVLSQVGTEKMASGFRQGENVLSAAPEFSLDQRYNEYHGHITSTDMFADLQTPGSRDGNTPAIEHDAGLANLKRPDGQKRTRVLSIITEQVDEQGYFVTRRVKWEKARRYGRSQAIRLEADSWRDRKGKLWEPNYRVMTHIPSCKVVDLELVIGEVTYMRDEQGTRASLVLMPPEAYQPEPVIINPFAAMLNIAPAASQSAGQG
ncbi:MAG: contractile injection system protein, VgrG/Pvc8 family [Acetobacteraceae bacterium]